MAYGEGWTVRFRECKCPVSYKMFKVDPNPGTFIASTKNFICKKWWLFVFSLWVAQQIRLIGFTFNGEFCLARMAVIEMHEKNIENKKTCSAIHWFRHRLDHSSSPFLFEADSIPSNPYQAPPVVGVGPKLWVMSFRHHKANKLTMHSVAHKATGVAVPGWKLWAITPWNKRCKSLWK